MNSQQSAVSSKSFDPAEQIDGVCDEIDKAMIVAEDAARRVRWLKDQLCSEIEQIRNRRDQLEIYDEAAAAAILTIELQHLADLRRRLDLPHINFGNRIRYTKRHLSEIVLLLEIRGRKVEGKKQRAEVSRQLQKAA